MKGYEIGENGYTRMMKKKVIDRFRTFSEELYSAVRISMWEIIASTHTGDIVNIVLARVYANR